MRGTGLQTLLALCLITTLGAGSRSTASASTDERYFAATGHSVVGKFLAYWDGHGGLSQFGYPISDEFTEVSNLDGKSYGVQYFERAEFEHHPENQPPYDVELAQLGTLRYQQIYPNGASGQQANTNNPYTFAATSMSIGGAFRAYWEQHGGLAQFGYPISNEFQEVSNLNGQTYMVQYFERVEFEHHPENQPPYDVLLAQLGKFYCDASCSGAVSPANSIRQISDKVLGQVVTTDRFLFWQSISPSAVMGYSLDTGETFTVFNKSVMALATNGKKLIWLAEDGQSTVVQSYDPTTQNISTLMRPGPLQYTAGPAGFVTLPSIAYSGDLLIYQDATPNHRGIYVRNITSGEERQISANGTNPVVADGILLWSEPDLIPLRGNIMSRETYLHMLKLDGSIADTQVTNTELMISYSASGSNIAWSSYDDGVNIYNVATASTRRMPNTGPNKDSGNRMDLGFEVAISGSKVAWTDQREPGIGANSYIKVLDLNTGSVGDIVAQTSNRMHVRAITKQNMLVYTEEGFIVDGDSLFIANLK